MQYSVCSGLLAAGAATAALKVNVCQDSPLAVPLARAAGWCVSRQERAWKSLLLMGLELNKQCCSLLPCGASMSRCCISGQELEHGHLSMEVL